MIVWDSTSESGKNHVPHEGFYISVFQDVVLRSMLLSLPRNWLAIVQTEISLEGMNGVLNKYEPRIIWNWLAAWRFKRLLLIYVTTIFLRYTNRIQRSEWFKRYLLGYCNIERIWKGWSEISRSRFVRASDTWRYWFQLIRIF